VSVGDVTNISVSRDTINSNDLLEGGETKGINNKPNG